MGLCRAWAKYRSVFLLSKVGLRLDMGHPKPTQPVKTPGATNFLKCRSFINYCRLWILLPDYSQSGGVWWEDKEQSASMASGGGGELENKSQGLQGHQNGTWVSCAHQCWRHCNSGGVDFLLLSMSNITMTIRYFIHVSVDLFWTEYSYCDCGHGNSWTSTSSLRCLKSLWRGQLKRMWATTAVPAQGQVEEVCLDRLGFWLLQIRPYLSRQLFISTSERARTATSRLSSAKMN